MSFQHEVFKSNRKLDNREISFDVDKRNVKFFQITGHTLVYPYTYQMQEFHKQIIKTSIFNNTIICLPSGLGKSYLAALITFNFQRWFLNGKIIVLSQSRNYLNDQLSAYSSYTTLSKETCAEIAPNIPPDKCVSLWSKSIILTTPPKFLDGMNRNTCKIKNLVLLIVFETNKISKCQEYAEIIGKLNISEFRILVFIEPVGFNTKIIKQIVETFHISKLEIRNVSSSDISNCTFCSEIESVAVDISQHIISIKDSFYAVFEKYGKQLKDAKVVTGNVACLTRAQLQKAKEKFAKNVPQNMPKVEQVEILNSITMCAFLCYGIELLHNWGVRTFYSYLFDGNKDDDLKLLIVNDEHLKTQMKLLNEYLKTNGQKKDSSLHRIIHPKLLYCRDIIARCFSNFESTIGDISFVSETRLKIEDPKVLVVCSIDDIIDELDRLFRNFPDSIRHSCVKVKIKNLSSESKEIIKCFKEGVINVLVISNLVEEISDLNVDLIISLEPNKSLLRLSDPRFYEGAKKCVFILVKGTEYNKFESMLNEKKNEQKPVDVSGMEFEFKDGPKLFPENFDPEFEGASVVTALKTTKNTTTGQKSLLQYLGTPDKQKNDECSFEDVEESSNLVTNNETPVQPDDMFNLDFENDSIFAMLETPKHDNVQKFRSPYLDTSTKKKDEKCNFDDVNNLRKSDIDDESTVQTQPNRSPSPELFDDEEILPIEEVRQMDATSFQDDIVYATELFGNRSATSSRNHSVTNKTHVVDLKNNESNVAIKSPFLKPPSANTILNSLKTDRKRFTCDLADYSQRTASKPSSVTAISKENLQNETFCDFLFPDSPLGENFNEERGNDEQKKCENLAVIGNDKRTIDGSNYTSLFFDETAISNPADITVENAQHTGTKGKRDSKLIEHSICSPHDTAKETDVDISDLKNVTFVDDLFADDSKPNETVSRSLFEKTESCNSKSVINETGANEKQIGSPVLFSSKKPDRKRSKMKLVSTTNKNNAINFDSTIDTTDENLLQIDSFMLVHNSPEPRKESAQQSIPIEELVKRTNSIESKTKCDFSTFLFDDDDDIFIKNITTNENFATPNKINASKTSTPLLECTNKSVDEVSNNIHRKTDSINDDTSRSDKNSRKIFSNFSVSLRRTIEENEKKLNSKCSIELKNKSDSLRFDDDSDEEFPWTKVGPKWPVAIQENAIQNMMYSPGVESSRVICPENNPSFKKPLSVSNLSHWSSTPESSYAVLRKSYSTSSSNEKTPAVKKVQYGKKRKKLKRNLVEQFIDAEAEVSCDFVDDDDTYNEEGSQCSIDSFIDDDTAVTKSVHITNYLNSLKSPKNLIGKFHIPVLSDSKLRMDVCSQVDEDNSQDYEHDSFCVDDVDIVPDSYAPSVLTQMEERLDHKKKEKRKTKQLKRIIENITPPKFKNQRKRIKYFSSSESDEC